MARKRDDFAWILKLSGRRRSGYEAWEARTRGNVTADDIFRRRGEGRRARRARLVLFLRFLPFIIAVAITLSLFSS